MPKKKAVVDPMGQWKYPGDVTIIPSNSITMQGVNYPVLGVDDLGNAQMMMPGGQYTFPGNYVTEFPQMQLGGMSKRKVDKYLQSNKDLNWVKRLYQPNTPTMYLPGSSVPSTHYMESADGRVYPTIVQRTPNSPLEYLGDDAYDYAMQSGEYIQFPNDRQARRFAESYKKGTDVLKEFGKGGLTQWFAEEWTDIKTGKPCGRQKGEKRAYPACRPKKRVNETTPKTTSEMSSSEKAKFKRVKNSGERISYNHKRREFGGEMGWLDQYQDGGSYTFPGDVSKIASGNLLRPQAPNYTPKVKDIQSILNSVPSYNWGYEDLKDVDPTKAGIQSIGPLTKERTEQLNTFKSDADYLNQYRGTTFGSLPMIEGSNLYEGYSPTRIWTGKRPWIPTVENESNTSTYTYMVAPKQEGTAWNWNQYENPIGESDFFIDPKNPKAYLPRDSKAGKELYDRILKADPNFYFSRYDDEGNSYIKNLAEVPYNELENADWGSIAARTGLRDRENFFPNYTPIYWDKWYPTLENMLKDPAIRKYSQDNNLNLEARLKDTTDHITGRKVPGYYNSYQPGSHPMTDQLIEAILAKKDAELNNRPIGHATGEGYGVIQDPSQFNFYGYLPNDVAKQISDNVYQTKNQELEKFKATIPETWSEEDRQKQLQNYSSYLEREHLNNLLMDAAGVPDDLELRKRMLFHTNAFPIQEYRPSFKNGGWLDSYQDGGETSTEQSPDRITPVEISAKRDPWYKRLPRQVADRMGFYPYGYDTNPNDFSSQMARRIASADSPAGAFFGALTAPLATPQLGAMYAMTGEAQTPSEYYNVQNPYAAFALNALTDPLTYAGTGAFTNIPSKISNTVSRQIYKNPKLGVNLATGLRLPIKNIDNITVSPGLKPGDIELSSFLSPAKGVSEQQFIERLASGAQSLDQSLQKRISDLKSPEGFKRLVNQEKEYYLSKGEIPSVADDLANLSAKARINELENTYSWNTAAKDYGETNVFAGRSELSDFSKDNLLLNNAYYRQTSPNSGSTFSPYYKSDPGSIGIGYNVVGNKPIEMHEIAHALQRGRVLPIDDELRQLTPKKNLPSNTQRAYDYFSSGTGGREASAFANELRESMFQKGFIPDYYSPISQQQVQNAYGYFKTNPMGVYDPNNARYLSNTRIFDFMAPTKANSKLLTDILNKLPAAIPVAAGASQLRQQKNGGWLNKYN